MDPIEKQLYGQAAAELANKAVDPAVMAKAVADAEGDSNKSTALYIKYRVVDLIQLAQGYAEEQAAQAERDQQAILSDTRKAEIYQSRLETLRLEDYHAKWGRRDTVCPECKFDGCMKDFRKGGSWGTVVCTNCKHQFGWTWVPSPDLERRAAEGL